MKILTLCLIMAAAAPAVHAQTPDTLVSEAPGIKKPFNPKHNFSVGLGYLSTPVVLESIGSFFSSALLAPASGEPEIELNRTATTHISYTYQRSRKSSIGLIYAYTALETTRDYPLGFSVTDDVKYHTFMIHNTYTYLFLGPVQVYSTGDFGFTYRDGTSRDSFGNTASKSRYYLAGQFNLLGLSAGKQFNVYTEVGWGFLGLVQFGARYRL